MFPTNKANMWLIKHLTDFKKMAKDKAVSKNTIVFNNLVNSKGRIFGVLGSPCI